MQWIFAILLTVYPYTIALGASDVERDAYVQVTVSAPDSAHITLAAPAWVDLPFGLQHIAPETWQGLIHIHADAPDAYGRVVLLVDGAQKDSAPIRIGAPRGVRVWLPLIRS